MNCRIRFTTLFALLCLTVTPAFSSILQDWEFNINGTDYYPAGGATFGTVPGLDASGINTTTGLGSATITFSPGAAGSYYLGAWFFDPVAVPFYNEYGAKNGSPASGESWQIDIPEYDAVSANIGTGTIIDNLANGALNNTNTVPGTTTNYLHNCGAYGGGAANPNCNDIVSMALGFNFTLASNQYEVITLTLGTSNPGGFSLEDIHPVDGSNTTQSAVYFSASSMAVTVGTPPPPPPGVPEPASAFLGVIGVALLTVGGARRRLTRS
jgi:hypothetical protein